MIMLLEIEAVVLGQPINRRRFIIKKLKENKELAFEILAILLIIIYAVSLSPKTLQNDAFYTVSVGKQIIENGIDLNQFNNQQEFLSEKIFGRKGSGRTRKYYFGE